MDDTNSTLFPVISATLKRVYKEYLRLLEGRFATGQV